MCSFYVLAVGNYCYVAVCSAARGASAPAEGGDGRGHIVSAIRLQLVLFNSGPFADITPYWAGPPNISEANLCVDYRSRILHCGPFLSPSQRCQSTKSPYSETASTNNKLNQLNNIYTNIYYRFTFLQDFNFSERISSKSLGNLKQNCSQLVSISYLIR